MQLLRAFGGRCARRCRIAVMSMGAASRHSWPGGARVRPRSAPALRCPLGPSTKPEGRVAPRA
eukprot:5809789-Lingulodinium_polyedra.AAC.1